MLGDLTTNHVGDGHEWFVRGAPQRSAPEREFFFFDERLEHGYESWAGVPSLPKLDYRSPELQRRVFGGDSSVVERWLEPPFSLDGWRIDVANMTGRRGDLDVSAAVARGVRAAAVAARDDALVVAEHAHDARADLRVGAWHGTMAYAGFTRPVWAWLRGDNLPPEQESGFLGLPVGIPRLPGDFAVETMKRFRAGLPWASVLHSWAILSSHDTARFSTIAGSRDRHLVGVGLQMTTPGVPMVFAGDEIGLEGEWGEDARRTMPWSHPDAWDAELHDGYRRLALAAPREPCARARRYPLRARLGRCDRVPARGRGRDRSLPGRAGAARAGPRAVAALGGRARDLARRGRARSRAARQSSPRADRHSMPGES